MEVLDIGYKTDKDVWPSRARMDRVEEGVVKDRCPAGRVVWSSMEGMWWLKEVGSCSLDECLGE